MFLPSWRWKRSPQRHNLTLSAVRISTSYTRSWHKMNINYSIQPSWHSFNETIWGFPKIGGKPPKWMVKIMENPIKHGMIWGDFTPLFLDSLVDSHHWRDPCLNIDPRLDLAREKKSCEGIDDLVISCPKAPWDVMGCQVATCFKALFGVSWTEGRWCFHRRGPES